ncbi:MAG: hypothetical protein RID09_12300 [Coleofasciculus sp. G1-WW12-02]|uniref:hypothetical protein n=1 Tax=unclassified Coleofasciculus TaxID=2692782 RepID=UPI0032F0BCB3
MVKSLAIYQGDETEALHLARRLESATLSDYTQVNTQGGSSGSASVWRNHVITNNRVPCVITQDAIASPIRQIFYHVSNRL